MCVDRASTTMASVNRRTTTASQGGSMSTSPHTNLAARMGRWSARPRKIAIFGWLAFVISAVVIGTGMGQRSIEEQNRNVGQAGRADEVLKKAGFAEAGALTEIVVVQDKHATISDPKFRSAVEA